jgi:hypothetical protein
MELFGSFLGEMGSVLNSDFGVDGLEEGVGEALHARPEDVISLATILEEGERAA